MVSVNKPFAAVDIASRNIFVSFNDDNQQFGLDYGQNAANRCSAMIDIYADLFFWRYERLISVSTYNR